ncbi:MAG: 3' terminal RNA ribose 2'-O-methyltransferase Hen1 [Dehalococcoidia bacterium]
MLLTITSLRPPATDLGYLLHKNPARVQTFPLAHGKAHVFYPEAGAERCTAALLLDIDPVGLVRNRRGRGGGGEGGGLDQYVNDRPYVASSFLSVAIAQVFGSALSGRSAERPELVETPLPLEAKLTALPSRGGEELLRRLFRPLGYRVAAEPHLLDEQFPEWGASPYFTVTLTATIRLRDLLSHLYVLVPVLDDEKHYWVGDDEVEKLLHHGSGWLASHPDRDLIAARYLRHRRRLTREALARLTEEDTSDPDSVEELHGADEQAIEETISLNEQRLGSVLAAIKQSGAKRVLDLSCGEGRLLRALLDDRGFSEILGVDVSYRALEIAQDRLKLERLPERQRERIKLLQSSLTYRDKRLAGFDAAAVVEVIEHLEPSRLGAFERVLFEFARPQAVVLTTPNAEYNVRFENLPVGYLRHRDHRFEWTRAEFRSWAGHTAQTFAYAVRFLPVGAEDPEFRPQTQMAVFTRMPASASVPGMVE